MVLENKKCRVEIKVDKTHEVGWRCGQKNFFDIFSLHHRFDKNCAKIIHRKVSFSENLHEKASFANHPSIRGYT